jgi:hypothetical protein
MTRKSLAERFEAKVDRSGEHHIWVGSKKADGTGKLKVDGKAVTAPRIAWALTHGSLSDGVEVVPCDVKACADRASEGPRKEVGPYFLRPASRGPGWCDKGRGPAGGLEALGDRRSL